MHRHAANKLEVKVLSAEGLTSHSGLRVMGFQRQRWELSVDRGMCGHDIELRNKHRESRPRWVVGKATGGEASKVSRVFNPRSHSIAARTNACLWNTGDPVIGNRHSTRLPGFFKVCDRTRSVHGKWGVRYNHSSEEAREQ
jgi:hypothetical protein